MALAGVDSRVLVGQKETEVKLRRPLEFCGSFALYPSKLTAVEQFLHWKLVSNRFFMGSSRPAMLPVFPRSFANAVMLYLPE